MVQPLMPHTLGSTPSFPRHTMAALLLPLALQATIIRATIPGPGHRVTSIYSATSYDVAK